MRFFESTRSWPRPTVVVIDGFYRDPRRARAWALRQEYFHPEDVTGWRSTRARVFPGAVRALRCRFGEEMAVPPADVESAHGVAFLALRRGARAEVPAVHYDFPQTAFVAVVYLSVDTPSDCGTSLWKHKSTGLTRAPVRADERRLRARCEDIQAELDHDSGRPSRWIEVDRIGHRFNRAVVYPCYLLHSATRHHGTNVRNGRVYQLLNFGRGAG